MPNDNTPSVASNALLDSPDCPNCCKKAVRESSAKGAYVCENGHTFFPPETKVGCDLCGRPFERGDMIIRGEYAPFCYFCAVKECEKELKRRNESNPTEQGIDHENGKKV